MELFALALADLIWIALYGVINAVACLIEWIGRMFVSGFSIKRLRRSPCHYTRDAIKLLIVVLLVMVGIGGLAIQPLLHRELTVVDQDGEPASFVDMLVERGDRSSICKTNADGIAKIPRFGVTLVSLRSRRYQDSEWRGEDLPGVVKVERSLLGKGLDALGDRLFDKH